MFDEKTNLYMFNHGSLGITRIGFPTAVQAPIGSIRASTYIYPRLSAFIGASVGVYWRLSARLSASIGVYRRLSAIIRVYSRVSTSIRVYPPLSASIGVYRRLYPRVYRRL